MDRIRQLKSFLEKTPNDAFLNYALATEYVAKGQDELALILFERLQTANPEYFATYYHLGKLYERMDEYDMAKKTYEEGLKITNKLGEKHAYGELRGVYEELTF